MSPKAKKPSLTESQLIDRLRARYGEKSGNGNAYAFIPGVQSAAAFDARRTIDAYAMSLWPSRGLTLTAFECKSSRSDWKRELEKPEKAEEFCGLADYFYLVVGDAAIVQPGELPETWGLMVPHAQGLKVTVEAPRLRPSSSDFPPAFGRSFLAALLRSACYVGSSTPEEIKDAKRDAFEHAKDIFEGEATRWREAYTGLQGNVAAFQEASGLVITNDYLGGPQKIGETVRAILNGDQRVDRHLGLLRRLRDEAARTADYIGRQVDALEQEAS